MHTTLSDGKRTPDEVRALYRSHGYDFLALTDHRNYNFKNFAPETGLIVVPGMEMDGNITTDEGMCFHTVCIGPEGEANGFRQDERFQSAVVKDQFEYQPVVDELRAKNNLVIYCHPDWSCTPARSFEKLEGCFAMEIWNSGCVVENNEDVDNGLIWDELLVRGKRIFAVDDSAGNIAEGIPVVRSSNLKAWVSVMYGCNNFCSYCIVPYVRGRERSRRPEEILEEVKGLIAAGYKDITLLGQNVNSYGKDLGLGVDFADLLGELAELPGEFWLRFMTSHPKDATKKLFDTIASHEKIAKQFHLPFQSGNDRVLKVMNRHYDSAQYLALVDYGRSLMPGLVLTSDVIVGFPGETEEEFEDTLSLIEEVRYDALFTFIFSPRAGTPAAKMDDPTPKEEKNHRFDRLCDTQNRISLEIHQGYVGRTLRVLVDGREKEMLTARTEGGRLVRFAGDDSLIGQFLDVTITGCTTWSLVGEVK